MLGVGGEAPLVSALANTTSMNFNGATPCSWSELGKIPRDFFVYITPLIIIITVSSKVIGS